MHLGGIAQQAHVAGAGDIDVDLVLRPGFDVSTAGDVEVEPLRAYVDQCLAKTLRRNDIVVMDNLQAHKVAGIAEAIERVGASVRYLPKYSPDLNPIELLYSKFKDYLRKAAERTLRGIRRAIRKFGPQLGAQECANYFRHAGYASK